MQYASQSEWIFLANWKFWGVIIGDPGQGSQSGGCLINDISQQLQRLTEATVNPNFYRKNNDMLVRKNWNALSQIGGRLSHDILVKTEAIENGY